MNRRRTTSRQWMTERLEARRCLAAISYAPHIIDGTEFNSPESIRSADFDGDGDADVFVSAQNQDGWYENVDGQLASFHPVVGTGPRRDGGRVLAEDLDGDRDIDVMVIANNMPVYWLSNQGDGQFGRPITVLDRLPTQDHLALADVNQDSHVDLIIAEESCNAGVCTHVVAWFANRGDGTWESRQNVVTVQPRVVSMQMIDLNNDQRDDLVLGSPHCSIVFDQCFYQTNWFPNTVDDGFASQPTRIHRHEVAELRGGAAMYWEDIDGDGDNDGLIVAEQASQIVWVENLGGTGTFAEPKSVAPWTERLDQTSVAIGDVDGDNDLDVVTVSQRGDMRLIRFDQAAQSFDAGVRLSHSFSSPTQVLIDDVSADGAGDIIVVSKTRNELAWFRRQFDAPSLFSPRSVVGHTLNRVARALPIDFDSDGDEDIVVATFESGFDSALEWYENIDGHGNFVRRFIRRLDSPWFGAADLDSDGDVDLLLEQNNTTFWLANNGQEGFGVGTLLTQTPFDVLDAAVPIDVDGDDDLDLVHVAFGEITWYENTDARGTFVRHEILTGLRRTERDFVGDYDADGDVDVVYHTSCSGVCDTTLTLLTNHGGTFAASTLLNLRRSSRVDLAFGDLDGDQDADMVIRPLSGALRTWMNVGNGDLREVPSPESVNGRSDFSFVDIDGDGDLDLAEIARYTDLSSWYENVDGNGQLAAPTPLHQFDSFRRLTMFADFNGNGLDDMLTARDTPAEIRWLESKKDEDDRPIGDSNGDGVFDSSDFVFVFRTGKYESLESASYAEGDWNGDGEFNSSDLVAAFQAGTYVDLPNPQ